MLKQHYQERIDLTAIDPSEEDIELTSKHNVDVKYIATTVLDMDLEQNREKFDVVVFSKSLHHCDPLDSVGACDLKCSYGRMRRNLKKKAGLVNEYLLLFLRVYYYCYLDN